MEVLLVIVVVVAALFLLTVFRGAPYVPTHHRNLEHAFTEVYPLKKSDLLVDIGSGDGVILRSAAQRGARAVGYEINPILVIISRLLARRYGEAISIRLADFWRVKFPEETTIVYTFGESRDINKMFKKVQQEATRLQKPLHFMSYGFQVEGQKEIKHDRSFRLYLVEPLH